MNITQHKVNQFFGRITSGKKLIKVVSNFWIVIIGGMCYTLYIFQKLILSVAHRITLAIKISDSYQFTFYFKLY